MRDCVCGGKPLYLFTPLGSAIGCAKCDKEVYGTSKADVIVKWDALQESKKSEE